MDFMRNPEIRRGVILWLVGSVLICTGAFLLDERCGALALLLCALFCTAHFLSDYRRYRRIRELSYDIDRVLHSNRRLDVASHGEGELAVLQSEIYKMTVRLQEQAEALLKDKAYLADAMADISHQIRTPLTSIHLVVNFLSEDELDDGRRMGLVKDLYGLLDRIDWLIDTLLKMSKLDAGTVRFSRVKTPMEALIRKAAEPLAIPMELREQRLVVRCRGDESFFGDLPWTVEALENILKNCMEHTPSGGTLTVTAAETPIYSELIVSDNGPGIDEEDLPHLFERFYRGKNAAAGGIGIGLALARMIIAAQNGSVKAGRGRDGGAEFTIRFYKGTV